MPFLSFDFVSLALGFHVTQFFFPEVYNYAIHQKKKKKTFVEVNDYIQLHSLICIEACLVSKFVTLDLLLVHHDSLNTFQVHR